MTDPPNEDPEDTNPVSRPSETDQALPVTVQWVVLGIVVGMLIVIPIIILVWPPTLLSFRDAYLGLSLVPGIVLGALIVWLATRSR